MGVPVVGVPKTIDNDLGGTDVTFGFDTAIGVACEALDRLHSTAASHHRVMILEVMGRHAGWIALHAGLAGGADVILHPRDPVRPRRASPIACRPARATAAASRSSWSPRAPSGPTAASPGRRGSATTPSATGSAAISYRLAEELAAATGHSIRNTVLGHVQRGGSPSPFDRVLATRYGVAAVETLAAGKTGVMVSLSRRRDHDGPDRRGRRGAEDASTPRGRPSAPRASSASRSAPPTVGRPVREGPLPARRAVVRYAPASMDRIDLHAHTNRSDGSLEPEALVVLAKEAGLRALAVTDHDTTVARPRREGRREAPRHRDPARLRDHGASSPVARCTCSRTGSTSASRGCSRCWRRSSRAARPAIRASSGGSPSSAGPSRWRRSARRLAAT